MQAWECGGVQWWYMAWDILYSLFQLKTLITQKSVTLLQCWLPIVKYAKSGAGLFQFEEHGSTGCIMSPEGISWNRSISVGLSLVNKWGYLHLIKVNPRAQTCCVSPCGHLCVCVCCSALFILTKLMLSKYQLSFVKQLRALVGFLLRRRCKRICRIYVMLCNSNFHTV